MNSAEIKRISLAYNELFKSTRHFNDVRASLEEGKVDNTFNKDQVETIKKEYQHRLVELERFERELDKFEKFMPSSVFRQLKEALGNQKTILGRMSADAAGYLELGDDMYLESLINSFDKEKELSGFLAKEMSDFSHDLGFNILRQALDNKISLEDLRLMAAAFESDSELFDRINFTINFIERRDNQKLAVFDPEMVKPKTEEVTTVKKEEAEVVVENAPKQQTVGAGGVKPKVETQPNPQVQPPAKKPTLQEKIAAVNYKLGSNINAEVQELTVDDMLVNIQAQIAELEAKETLNLRETFKLRQLKEQELGFQAYRETLDKQDVSRREQKRTKKLDKTLGKIDSKEAELQEAIAQSQQYTSKTLRFFSARYQQKLNGQLESLRYKQGELTDMQKYSAMARFDKQSRKIVRTAKRKGTIDQLREFRDNILNELENIGHDMERFGSTKAVDMPQMTTALVVLPDHPISLDEQRRLLAQTKAA